MHLDSEFTTKGSRKFRVIRWFFTFSLAVRSHKYGWAHKGESTALAFAANLFDSPAFFNRHSQRTLRLFTSEIRSLLPIGLRLKLASKISSQPGNFMKEAKFDNWVNEISDKDIHELLNSPRRGQFLDTYEHFDGHQKVFQSWIFCNLASTKNCILEDLFVLAGKIRLVRKEINDLCLKVLKGRYRYFTKLACLDYLLWMQKSLDPGFYKTANTLAVEQTKNPIVLFQGTLNLCMSDIDKYCRTLTEQLVASEYPTLFYRLANQIWLFSENSRVLLAEIVRSVLRQKEFSDGVKSELLDRI